ncbi:PREDICTED: uncharacterized protein LOC106808494 [Priapulus caudatus]|uniref:Uncharacterized protein LOC106808494 n=1 Tax=Priapulus caudatus TaxID=37621 RepID=A0ABM1E3F1_PRICU|nr:PREDICTED: uncharacterized protein LOC106808494 [Priapulus caudatus]
MKCNIIKVCVCYFAYGLLLVVAKEDAVVSAKELISSVKENQELLQSIPAEYEIVYPVQVHHDHGRRNNVSTIDEVLSNTTRHFEHTTFRFKAFGEKFHLKLDLNIFLLSGGVIQKYFTPNDTSTTIAPVEHCYYQGTVRGHPGSVVAVRTCSGVSGVIHIANKTYVIQPVLGGDLGKRYPHIFYESSKQDHRLCGNTGRHEWGFSAGQRSDLHPESSTDAMRNEKFLELAMVVDSAIYEQHNASVSDTVGYALQVANIADMYFRLLSTKLVVVYVEVWGIEERMDASTDVRQTLLNFMDYSQSALFRVAYDSAQLLTGTKFKNREVGLALPDSMCTRRAVGVNQETNPVEPQQLASTLAHIIGHNLGMTHDDDGRSCRCKDVFGCMMTQNIVGKEGFHPLHFSSCSRSDYQRFLQTGAGSCLLNRPRTIVEAGRDHGTCGNGILEPGEQCDCGANQLECEKKDPCCDVYTCKLLPEAQCSTGPCCHQCKLKPRGSACREARSECDIEEQCDGAAGRCPMDLYVQDGQPCNLGRNYCHRGLCPSLTAQCRSVWGKQSMVGDQQCYNRFNLQGSEIGNCGTNKQQPVSCDKQHVFCGLLQCQHGSSTPLIPGLKHTFSKTTMSVGGREFECKTASGKDPSGTRHTGLVMDGTKCAPGMMCSEQHCVSVSSVVTEDCPKNNHGQTCSDHGLCTNRGQCHCADMWMGFDCSIKINVTTTTSTTARPFLFGIDDFASYGEDGGRRLIRKGWDSDKETVATQDLSNSAVTRELMFIILGAVVGAVLVAFAIFALCYRSRSSITSGYSYITDHDVEQTIVNLESVSSVFQLECEKKDPCCDVYTCKLLPEAQCSTGPCCHQCKLKPRGSACREARSECDIEEQCDGAAGRCPMDLYVQDGQPCNLGRNYCHRGLCPSLTAQCRSVWGKQSMVGDQQCYNRFNLQGSEIGNCGTNKQQPVSCDKQHVFCGLLQCQHGSSTPLIPGLKHTFSKTTMSVGGREFECKTASGKDPSGTRHTGLVMDGTKCAPGMMCSEQHCVSVSSVVTEDCPKNNHGQTCSDHGLCTNRGQCHCADMWMGFDCSIKINVTTTTSTTARPFLFGIDDFASYGEDGGRRLIRKGWDSDKETVATQDLSNSAVTRELMFIILGAVVGAVLVAFAIFALCYRRRSNITPWNKKKLPMKTKPLSDCDSESLANRIITFGSMPSYRESKILENRKKKGKGKGKTSAGEGGGGGEEDASVMRLRENIVSDLCRIPEKGILKKATLERQQQQQQQEDGSLRSLASQRSQASQAGSLASQQSQSQHGSLGSQRSQRSNASHRSQGSAASQGSPCRLQGSQGSPYRSQGSQGSPYRTPGTAASTRGTMERHPDEYLDRESQSSSDIGDDESPTHEQEHYQESADAENTGDDSVAECRSPERRPLVAGFEDDVKKMFLNDDYYSDCTEDFGSPDALPPPPFDANRNGSPPPSFSSVQRKEDAVVEEGGGSPARSPRHKENNLCSGGGYGGGVYGGGGGGGGGDMESSCLMPEPMKLQNIDDILQQIQRHSSTLSPLSSRSEDGGGGGGNAPSEADTERTLYRSRPPNAQLDLKKFATLVTNDDEDDDSAVAMSHDDMDDGAAAAVAVATDSGAAARGEKRYPRFGRYGEPPTPPRRRSSPTATGDADAVAGGHFIYDPATGNYFMWQDDVPEKVRNSTAGGGDFVWNLNYPQNQKPSSQKDKESVNTPSPSDNEHVTHMG